MALAVERLCPAVFAALRVQHGPPRCHAHRAQRL